MPRKKAPSRKAVKTSRKASPPHIVLDATLDSRASENLLAALKAAIGGDKPVIVDAASVERISTPCIQILLSAARSLESNERRLSVIAASKTFIDSFSALGLFPVLMSWQAES